MPSFYGGRCAGAFGLAGPWVRYANRASSATLSWRWGGGLPLTQEPTMNASPSGVPAVFTFSLSNPVRIVDIDGQPWFVAVDVCAALGIGNPSMALRPLDADEKGVSSTDTPGGQQNLSIINESGLYTLVLRCRDATKPGSVPHRFRKWVTSEVLPAIRKHGVYAAPAQPRAADTYPPAGAELMDARDMANLRRVVWDICSDHVLTSSWVKTVWQILRKRTGVQRGPFMVEHLPEIGRALREVYDQTEVVTCYCREVLSRAEAAIRAGGTFADVNLPALTPDVVGRSQRKFNQLQVQRLVNRDQPMMDHPEMVEPE